jgi:hypothetical protein
MQSILTKAGGLLIFFLYNVNEILLITSYPLDVNKLHKTVKIAWNTAVIDAIRLHCGKFQEVYST